MTAHVGQPVQIHREEGVHAGVVTATNGVKIDATVFPPQGIGEAHDLRDVRHQTQTDPEPPSLYPFWTALPS